MFVREWSAFIRDCRLTNNKNYVVGRVCWMEKDNGDNETHKLY